MNPTAIVYTSNTGYTEMYAKLLSEKTGLPVYSSSEAVKVLDKGATIIYLGWLMASFVKGYKKASKRYNIAAVCGVGLCDTGALLKEVRKAISLPESIPLFTLQGGMDHSKLKGIYKFMINALTKSMSSKANRDEGEERMLCLLKEGGDYVREENLAAVMEWYKKTL